MSCVADGLEVTPAQIGRIPFQGIEALSLFESRPRGAPAFYLMVFSHGQRRPFVIEIGNIDYAGFQALANIPAGMEKLRRLVILLGQGAATDTLVDKDTGAFLQTGQVARIRKLDQKTPLALATAFATYLAAKRERVPAPQAPAAPRVAPQVQAVPQNRTTSPALAGPQVASRAQAVPQVRLASPEQAAPQAPPQIPAMPQAQTASPVLAAPQVPAAPQARAVSQVRSAPPSPPTAKAERPIRRLQPAFMRILSSDYAATLSLIVVGIGWLLFILAANGIFLKKRFSGPTLGGPETNFLAYAVIATVVFLPLGILRVRSIARVFENGLLCRGTITDISFVKDRGRVEFRYTLGGKTFNQGSAIMKNARTKLLRVGQEVDLAVDPDKPTRAFIMELYAS